MDDNYRSFLQNQDDPFSLALHQFPISFIKDRFAKEIRLEMMTLPQLADIIEHQHGPKKEKLPWLKLALFGDKRSKRDCLRTNANTLEVNGVEIDHDACTMSFAAMIDAMETAKIRCIAYTSPSFVPGTKEKWRVLAPTSEPMPPSVRVSLTERLNGVLKGAAAEESFSLSQAFLYGAVDGNPHHQVVVIDGDFIDLCDDLDKGKIGKPPAPRSERVLEPADAGQAIGRSNAEIKALLEKSRITGQWHNAMLSATASMIGKGWSDERIDEVCKPYCPLGLNEDDFRKIVRGGREKYRAPDPGIDWPARIGATLKAIAAKAESERCEEEPAAPGADAELNEKAAWLINTHAYLASEDSVVRIYDTQPNCQLKPAAFDRLFRAWSIANPNRRFKRPVFATDLWDMSPARQNLAGVRMRPDQPFPLYREGARLFKNVYRAPQHPVGDEAGAFWIFMERFLPDATEREWLLDWMAHKQTRPDIPGTAVIFVADNEEDVREGRFGTGRGILFRIVSKLYGEEYVTSQDFNILDGSSSQSTYNDWLHESILVTVDEAKTSSTAYRRGERSAAYEVLKNIVDPVAKKRSFKGKYRQAFQGMSYCSFWVASNHANAVAIPENDRRFTVLRNGREITPAEAKEIVGWMSEPVNIGALAAALSARDLSGFDMLVSPKTTGKSEMAEMALSEVDEMLRDIMDDPTRGLAFTKGHLENAIAHNYSGQSQFWRGEFTGLWHTYCAGLHTPEGGPRRLRVAGTQRKLFCFRNRRREVEKMPVAAIRREVAKWGGIDPVSGLTEIIGLGEKDE